MASEAVEPAGRGCACPRIALEDYEDRCISFNLKPFLARRIPLFFGIPIGFMDEMRSLVGRAAALALALPAPPMLLQRKGGIFRGQLLFAIADDLKLPEVQFLTGTYQTMVHRGPQTELGKAARRFEDRIGRERGIRPGELFFWYVNCPACRGGAGAPATVLLARIGIPTADVRETRPA